MAFPASTLKTLKLESTVIALAGCCLGFSAQPAQAASVTLSPATQFEAIDAVFFGQFDGQGDRAYPQVGFAAVATGTIGASADMTEFNLNSVAVPAGESILSAQFQAKIFSTGLYGLGINATLPTQLGIYGYVGNGLPNASDFQAGTLLETLTLSSPKDGDLLTFDVTNFIKSLMGSGTTYAGFGVKAEDYGGLFLEGSSSSKLTIATGIIPSDPEPVPEPMTILGTGAALAFGALMRKRQQSTAS